MLPSDYCIQNHFLSCTSVCAWIRNKMRIGRLWFHQRAVLNRCVLWAVFLMMSSNDEGQCVICWSETLEILSVKFSGSSHVPKGISPVQCILCGTGVTFVTWETRKRSAVRKRAARESWKSDHFQFCQSGFSLRCWSTGWQETDGNAFIHTKEAYLTCDSVRCNTKILDQNTLWSLCTSEDSSSASLMWKHASLSECHQR